MAFSSTSVNVTSNGAVAAAVTATPSVSVNEEEALSTDSSSDEDDSEVFPSQLGQNNQGPIEEQIIKRNNDYLLQRCASLMKQVQGIMQTAAAKHVSKQLQAVLEHPGLNPNLQRMNKSVPPLTKQGLAEVQFTGNVLTNIVRHSMGRQLDPNDDSGTDESDTDEDEVVLPDERMLEPGTSSEYLPYLPVENNPFMEAIKMEKQFEARRTSLEYSINECEYSLTKSLHFRKHCKGRKPLFELEKPTSGSTYINIPVDPTSSVKFFHDKNLATVRRVNQISPRRASIEKEKAKANGTLDTVSCDNSQVEVDVEGTEAEPMPNLVPETVQSCPAASAIAASTMDTDSGSAEMPSLKTSTSEDNSMLEVELTNPRTTTQSSSRCMAVKRPDKNRKVFQLGGIQNIFRDATRLPTVRCSCFGRSELCALCLGRAKKKSEINQVLMSHKDKLAILDETFHKSLSLSEDVPLEVLLVAGATGINSTSLIPPSNSIKQLIKARSEQFPPDFLETGPRPKRPRVYDIKAYVEVPVRSQKKDRYEEMSHAPRRRQQARKSHSFDDKDPDYTGKGLDWNSRERKDSMRRTRNQEFDIDNIVIPYSMAASTRVEQLVYKPIETPRWRVLDYSEIFSSTSEDKLEGELEDMSNAAFLDRHNKCEIDEKKRFTAAVKKAQNTTRKTRRLDSTGRSESISESVGLSAVDEIMSVTPPRVPSPAKTKDKEMGSAPGSTIEEGKGSSGTSTPVMDNSSVITEAMANQALKSLYKVGRRRTASTTMKTVEAEEEDKDKEIPPVVNKLVDPWPQRKFPLPEKDYKEMVEVMQAADCPVGITSYNSSAYYDDLPSSP